MKSHIPERKWLLSGGSVIFWAIFLFLFFSYHPWGNCDNPNDPNVVQSPKSSFATAKVPKKTEELHFLSQTRVVGQKGAFPEKNLAVIKNSEEKEKIFGSHGKNEGINSLLSLKNSNDSEDKDAPKIITIKPLNDTSVSKGDAVSKGNHGKTHEYNQEKQEIKILKVLPFIKNKNTPRNNQKKEYSGKDKNSQTALTIEPKKETPSPGQIINRENIDKYSHFFPPNFIPIFKNGWNLIEPAVAKVKKKVPNHFCKTFQAAIKLNNGRYSLDQDGYIQEDTTYLAGLPFPKLDPKDPQFAVKLMWNYEFKYDYDELQFEKINLTKTGGKPFIGVKISKGKSIRFQNRMYREPKPFYSTPLRLQQAQQLNVVWPGNRHSGGYLIYRFLDQMKTDATYYYSLGTQGVLRGESNSRSAPLAGSTLCMDDFNVFAGRIAEFHYELIGAGKFLVCGATDMDYQKDLADIRSTDHLVFPMDMELRDVFIIDIVSKDKRYLQGRKRIYIDKENYNIYYGEIWDRAKRFWKLIYAFYEAVTLPDGETTPIIFGLLGVDTQLGLVTASASLNRCNDERLSLVHFDVSGFRKLSKR